MHTLVFCGSPHEHGDTSALICAFLEALGGTHEVVRAYGAGISPCTDCRACWKTPGCAIPDAMQGVYEKIRAADCVVIASPVYYSALTGPLLSLLSRLQCVYANGRFLNHALLAGQRLGVVLLAGGGNGRPDPALETARHLLRALHARPVGCAMSLHTDDLPARQDAAALEAARALARRVRQQSAQQDAQEDQM